MSQPSVSLCHTVAAPDPCVLPAPVTLDGDRAASGAPAAASMLWRRAVSLSEDVERRQQWAPDLEPLLVAQ